MKVNQATSKGLQKAIDATAAKEDVKKTMMKSFVFCGSGFCGGSI